MTSPSSEPRQPGDVLDGRAHLTITRAQNAYVGWAMTLLIYIVVLNLFVEYVDSVVIDSFTISIFTSLVLLIMLVAILGLEHRVHGYFAGREGTAWRVAGALSVMVILFSSKFVILEVVDIIFGEHVELGGFVEIIVIVIALIAAQRAGALIWRRLGDTATGDSAPIISD